MTRRLGIALCIGLLSATLGVAANRGNEELMRDYTGDATTFCGDVDPDGQAMSVCFEKHRKELSKKCLRAIDAYQAQGGE